VRRGDLLLAVATSGQSPALSRVLRQQLETDYGPEWAILVKIAAALRSRMLTVDKEKTYYFKVLEKLLAGGLVKLVADRRTNAIDKLLTRVLGRETTLAQLGLYLRDDSP
jgi:precorrin-2 dehydrogenase/sirohydrochlorin ferrochelatase